MAGTAVLRVYRPSFPSFYGPGGAAAAGFFLVGLSMVTIGLTQRDGLSAVIIGAVTLLFSAWMMLYLATTRLIVTSAGLVHWHNLRKRFIGWAEIQAFGVGRGRSRMGWPVVIIYLSTGAVIVTNVVGYARSRPARIADELTALQREFAHGLQPSGEQPGKAAS